MPEGPQVYNFADKLRQMVGNSVLDMVIVGNETRHPHSRVSKIFTKGKRIFITLENKEGIVLAFALGGKLTYYESPSQPETTRSTIAALKFQKNDGKILYVTLTDPARFAVAYMDSTDNLYKKYLPKGFDPLHTIIGMKEWLSVCKKYSGQLVANFLINQDIVAGIGNRYRSEVMYVAKIPAASRVGELVRDQLEQLLIAIYRVMKMASRGEYRYAVCDQSETEKGEPVAKVEVAKGVFIWTVVDKPVSKVRKLASKHGIVSLSSEQTS